MTLPAKTPYALGEKFEDLDADAAAAALARASWLATARADQLRPTREFGVWSMIAGRGAGKTRAGAEETWWPAYRRPRSRWAVVGPTLGDARRVCFEGVSGLLNVIPRRLVAEYNRTTLEMWLTNGSQINGYSSEEPERLRGPEFDGAWCDELAAWRKDRDADTWDMLEFCLRLGRNPQVIVTTTPKNRKLRRAILSDSGTVRTTVSTFANAANLPDRYIERLRRRYDGTRLGRQELYAELLTDLEGALWTDQLLRECTVDQVPGARERTVVSVDPAGTAHRRSNMTGIVVSTRVGSRAEGVVYNLEDRTGRYKPNEWAQEAVRLYDYYNADAIVAETNQGGDMVESTIRTVDANVNIKRVHAKVGKKARAEPVAALYEQGRVLHLRGRLEALEDQMTQWDPDSDPVSPDRIDAMVQGVTDLLVERHFEHDFW